AGANLKDWASVAQGFEEQLATGLLTDEETKSVMRNLALVYFQIGNSQKGIDAAKAYLAKYGEDSEILGYLADADYSAKDYAGAADAAHRSVKAAQAAGQKPVEEVLKIWLVASQKIGNKADYGTALDELVVEYPSPDVWHDALLSIPNRPGYSA